MTLRISRGSVLATAPFRARRLLASTDQVIEAVAVIESDAKTEHTALAQLPSAEAPDAQQLTRAVAAYARMQNALRGFAVGHYLHVRA